MWDYTFENEIRKFYRKIASFQQISAKMWRIYIVYQKKCVSLRAISRKREMD